MARKTDQEEVEDIIDENNEEQGWGGGSSDEDFDDAVENDVGARPNVSDDTIRSYARQLVRIAEEAEVINAKRKSVRKLAKAAGITLGRLDAMLKLMNLTPDEQREHFAVERQYAAALRISNVPVGAQLDLISHATDTEVSMADAYTRGFQASVTGKGVFGVPPTELHFEAQQEWLRGWGDGQEQNLAGGSTEH